MPTNADLQVQVEALQAKVTTLQKQVTLYKGLFEQLPIPTMILRPDGTAVAINQAMETLTGVSSEHFAETYNLREDPAAIQKGDVEYFDSAKRGAVATMLPTAYDTAASSLKERTEERLLWTETTYFPLVEQAAPVGQGLPTEALKGATRYIAALITDVTAQKRAAEALKRAEWEKEVILDSQLEHVVYQDLEHKILWANRAACESVGATREDLIGEYCYEIWPQRSERCEDCPVAAAIAVGTPKEVEKTTPDGRSWFIRGYPVRDENGDIVGGIEVIQDISERKRAEQAMRLTNERLNSVLMAGNLAWWDWDYASGRVDFHERKATMLGYDPDELDPDVYAFTEMIHPDDYEQAMAAMRAHLSGAAPIYETEYRIRTQDGDWKWFYDRGAIVERDAEGQPLRIMGLVLDITERKSAEEALLREKNFSETLINNLPGIFYLYDEEGHLHRWNKNLETVTGYPHDVFADMTLLDFIPDEEKTMITEKIQRVFSGERVTTEGHLLTQVGEQIPYQYSAFSMEIDGKKYLVGTGMDISEHKQAEAERERLQQEIIDAQRQALQELSTPVIPVMDRILVMPLVGSIDTMRARDIMRALLEGISEYRAKFVILDVTGVPVMDTGVVNHINKTIQASRLKGAQTIVTGISDAVAEAVVDLGIDWGAVETLADLRTGLVVALDRLGVQLVGK